MTIKRIVIYFIGILFVFSSGHTFGATFNVKNAIKLQEALDIARNNGEGDVIKVYQGLYKGSFRYSSNEDHSIVIMGGYTSDREKINDPSKTILDGQYNDDYTLWCAGHGHIHIEGLTIQHGKAGFFVSSGSESEAGNVLLMNNIIQDNEAVGGWGGGRLG